MKTNTTNDPPVYATVEELITSELRHLPMAVHLDIKKAFEAGKRAASVGLLDALKAIAHRAVDYPRSEMARLNAETAIAAIAKAEGRT